MDDYSGSDDSDGYEEPDQYTSNQQASLRYLEALRDSNVERGFLQDYHAGRFPGLTAGEVDTAARAQDRFRQTGQALDRVADSWQRHPESQSRQAAYHTASNHHDMALQRWVDVGIPFHERVAAGLNERDVQEAAAVREAAYARAVAAQAGQGAAAQPAQGTQGAQGAQNPMAAYANFLGERATEVEAEITAATRRRDTQSSRRDRRNGTSHGGSSHGGSSRNGANGQGGTRRRPSRG
ncbi:hypothetical protein GCM10023220_11290 [Streptomyces ziwulingensis]|uniref:Uncharacterized protein n=1 Tax=Streptomyces ziwulingensis TaxID=1045501 RepID=A0ABP9B3G0_9ACTN